MPIFDMILSRPLLSADRTFATAAVSLTPRMRSARTRSSADSMSRYGLTADAPKDTSVAAWWTSRTSPASTPMLTRVRVRSRTRWWRRAEVSRTARLGTRSPVDPRPLRTMKITRGAPAPRPPAPAAPSRRAPRPRPHGVVVEGGGQEERGDRREIGRGFPVAEDDEDHAGGHGCARLGAQSLDAAGHGIRARIDRVQAGQGHRRSRIVRAE